MILEDKDFDHATPGGLLRVAVALIELREPLKNPMRVLAGILDVSESTLRNYLSNAGNPSPAQWAQFQRQLDVDWYDKLWELERNKHVGGKK